MTNELALEAIKEIKAQHQLHVETIKDIIHSFDGDIRLLNQFNEYSDLGTDQMHDLIGTIKEVYND